MGKPSLSATSDTRAALQRIGGAVELADVRLSILNSSISCDPDDLDEDWSQKASLRYIARVGERYTNSFVVWALFSLSYSLGDESGHFVDVGATLKAEERTEAEPEPEEEDDEEDEEKDEGKGDGGTSDVELRAVFDLYYKLEDVSNLDEADLETFATVNGVFNAWPYWRELAQSVTQRMGIGPVVIPVLTVAPLTD